MKRVLYLTNIEVPYRVIFFNELAKHCDLTVIYERKTSSNRNREWTKSQTSNYRVKYLRGINISNENNFSLEIFKDVFSKYDIIVVGCYNSFVQMLAILAMRLFRIPYFLNFDGEPFLEDNNVKNKLKRFFLAGADKYLVAGESAVASLKPYTSYKEVIPYYFSSMSDQEILQHRNSTTLSKRNNTILVVGQYFDYKGMDVALDAARLDLSIQYKFVGMGSRTDLFLKECTIPENVEIIPFLQKSDLQKEYQQCAMLVLPSRRECWGLVINEAASFGMPIVSTTGSGAAVEFLGQKYPQYLAIPGNASSLYHCIKLLKDNKADQQYIDYLQEKTSYYSIEKCVRTHLEAFGIRGGI